MWPVCSKPKRLDIDIERAFLFPSASLPPEMRQKWEHRRDPICEDVLWKPPGPGHGCMHVALLKTCGRVGAGERERQWKNLFGMQRKINCDYVYSLELTRLSAECPKAAHRACTSHYPKTSMCKWWCRGKKQLLVLIRPINLSDYETAEVNVNISLFLAAFTTPFNKGSDVRAAFSSLQFNEFLRGKQIFFNNWCFHYNMSVFLCHSIYLLWLSGCKISVVSNYTAKCTTSAVGTGRGELFLDVPWMGFSFAMSMIADTIES